MKKVKTQTLTLKSGCCLEIIITTKLTPNSSIDYLYAISSYYNK